MSTNEEEVPKVEDPPRRRSDEITDDQYLQYMEDYDIAVRALGLTEVSRRIGLQRPGYLTRFRSGAEKPSARTYSALRYLVERLVPTGAPSETRPEPEPVQKPVEKPKPTPARRVGVKAGSTSELIGRARKYVGSAISVLERAAEQSSPLYRVGIESALESARTLYSNLEV